MRNRNRVQLSADKTMPPATMTEPGALPPDVLLAVRHYEKHKARMRKLMRKRRKAAKLTAK